MAIKIAKVVTVLALSVLAGHGAWAFAPPPLPSVGEVNEITKSYETSERSSDGSSGSSSGHDTILERVVAVRDGGVELEYGPAESATPEEKARDWQFPARVFQPPNGPMQLLNAGKLEARLESWLKSGGWNRSVCGRWIFTWNAFFIDCDPQSAIETIEAFQLRLPDIRDGAAYQDAGALVSAPIIRRAATPNGASFTVMLAPDPAAVQRARAKNDVAIGEIIKKPVTFESALANRLKEEVSGAILISLETDATGAVSKRVKRTTLEIKRPDGILENRTATETVERRPVAATLPQP